MDEYENEVEALMKGDGRPKQRAVDTNWPESLPKPTTDGDMTSVPCNPCCATDSRLEEILRYYSHIKVIVLVGTSRGIRTAPRGKEWVDAKTPLRREYWIGSFYVFDLGYARRFSSGSTNKSCGTIIAIHRVVLNFCKIVERRDPPRRFAGRWGLVRLKKKTAYSQGCRDLLLGGGYAPQSDVPDTLREDYWTEQTRALRAPQRTTPVLWIDANSHVAPIADYLDDYVLPAIGSYTPRR